MAFERPASMTALWNELLNTSEVVYCMYIIFQTPYVTRQGTVGTQEFSVNGLRCFKVLTL